MLGEVVTANRQSRRRRPLLEVEPPPRRTRQREAFDPEVVADAISRLNRSKWVTDGKGYRSQSAAAHRAETLIKALGDFGIKRGDLQRRTWIDVVTRRWKWALALKAPPANGGRRRKG